ncbi:unnamed protein product, partial [Discosporangium mesarthrocarpum]
MRQGGPFRVKPRVGRWSRGYGVSPGKETQKGKASIVGGPAERERGRTGMVKEDVGSLRVSSSPATAQATTKPVVAAAAARAPGQANRALGFRARRSPRSPQQPPSKGRA